MDSNATHGGVTNSTGNVDRDGELVGRARYAGAECNVDPGRYRERPGLNERIARAGADVTAIRKMLGVS